MKTLADLAQELIRAALTEAANRKISIAVCVVDSGGHIVAHHRMDGVSYMANDVVRRKATTACNFRLPTHVFYQILQKQPALNVAVASQPDVLAVAGGMPILLDGTCIGGVGIGGGTFEQDQAIAEYIMQLVSQ